MKNLRSRRVLLAAVVLLPKATAVLADLPSTATTPPARTKLRLKIQNKIITATLTDNPTAREFAALLPLRLPSGDLFSREKYAALPHPISEAGTRTRTYALGDIGYWSPDHDVALYYRQDGEKIPEPGIIVVGKIDTEADAASLADAKQITIELR